MKSFGIIGLLVVLVGCTTAKPEATTTATPATPPLKVGVYADKGPSGIGAVEWFRLIDESPDTDIKLLDGEMIRAGGLEGLDVLVMPGGSSMTEYETLGTNGVAKMKDFIRKGGGYIGTCAGCCLLMDGPKKRARVFPWNTLGSEGDLFYPRVQVTETGAKAMGVKKGLHQMRYHGGPFMRPTTNIIEGAAFECWGTMVSEATFKGKLNPKKQMYGAAAIIGGTYGKGKVWATSCHPEYFDSTFYIIQGAFRYVTGREVHFPTRSKKPRAVAVGFVASGVGSVKDAQTALDLVAEKDFDVQLIDGDGIWMRRLDHVDVLVVPSSKLAKNASAMKLIKAFVARGGKLVSVGSGRDLLLGVGIACASHAEVVSAVRKLFP